MLVYPPPKFGCHWVYRSRKKATTFSHMTYRNIIIITSKVKPLHVDLPPFRVWLLQELMN